MMAKCASWRVGCLIIAALLISKNAAEAAEAQIKTTTRDCINQAIGELDDGISSADVIARAAVVECNRTITPETIDEVLARVTPYFVPEVLKHRAEKRRQQQH
jgi:hypothetical protein